MFNTFYKCWKDLFPKKTETPNLPYDSNPVVGKCSKCGLELRKAMWYYCNRFPCPSGLGSKVHM